MSTTKTKERKVKSKNIYYDGSKIILSGSVIVLDGKELLFEFDLDSETANVRIRFLKDRKGSRTSISDSTEEDINEVIIDFYNFKSSLGAGNVEPVDVFGTGSVFLNVWITQFDEQTSRFEYTFYQNESEFA
ncbi:MAG: hypothetical protein IPL26_29920 [Leptospiraceae bacterium]|nr:hypothetical protein [Leptospiraceae bacterium]